MDFGRQLLAKRVITLMALTMSSVCSMIVSSDSGITCKKINSCKCSYDNDQIIDLSPLIGNPRWLDQYGPQNVNMYSYNPCVPFNEGTCKNVSICQNTGAEYYALGVQESTEFSINPQTGVLSIMYSSKDSIGVTRTSEIVTECTTNGDSSFQALGETAPGSGYYLFTLTSRHCCPVSKPKHSSSVFDDLSTGSKIVIGFAGVVVLYLLLGMSVQKFIRQKKGRQVIPSYVFWSGLPSLVRDGCIISFSCGKHSTYESL